MQPDRIKNANIIIQNQKMAIELIYYTIWFLDVFWLASAALKVSGCDSKMHVESRRGAQAILIHNARFADPRTARGKQLCKLRQKKGRRQARDTGSIYLTP